MLLRSAVVIGVISLLIGTCFIFPYLFAQPALKEALYYEHLDKGNVQCHICPRNCFIPPGKRGFCGVRENRDGTLYALCYGKLVAIHVDPIEKKPLFHFLPGTAAFSVAAAGCNLRCKFCQNWEISQKTTEQVPFEYLEPAELIAQVKASGIPVIAYTYTEPVVFYEYMLDTAKLARKAGIMNVMHSAGYVNEAPLRELAQYLDAANIDLKGFTDEYYRTMSEGTLEPVLKSLKVLKDAGVHLEITTLILPGYNDDEASLKKMSLWIRDTLGPDTPLHFSRFWPLYKLSSLSPTPVATLEKARKIAMESGLRYVYIGNIPGHESENTFCPRCKKVVVKRSGYAILELNIKKGKCAFCGEPIEGRWE